MQAITSPSQHASLPPEQMPRGQAARSPAWISEWLDTPDTAGPTGGILRTKPLDLRADGPIGCPGELFRAEIKAYPGMRQFCTVFVVFWVVWGALRARTGAARDCSTSLPTGARTHP